MLDHRLDRLRRYACATFDVGVVSAREDQQDQHTARVRASWRAGICCLHGGWNATAHGPGARWHTPARRLFLFAHTGSEWPLAPTLPARVRSTRMTRSMAVERVPRRLAGHP
jgi:hypothetical protein